MSEAWSRARKKERKRDFVTKSSPNEVFFEDEVEMPFLTEAPSAIALRNMAAAERCFALNGVFSTPAKDGRTGAQLAERRRLRKEMAEIHGG